MNQKVYTILVKFDNGGTVYHYASRNYYRKGDVVEVETPLNGRVPAEVDGVIEGITDRATKWRTGSIVTDNIRETYGIKPQSGFFTIKNVTEQEVEVAARVFRLLQEEIPHLGFSIAGNIYFKREGVDEKPKSLPIHEAVKELFAPKEKVREQLKEQMYNLLAQVEEVKQKIKEL